MKLNKKEKALLNKINTELNADTKTTYASEIHRADRWTRSNVYRNRKAYSRKQKHKKDFE